MDESIKISYETANTDQISPEKKLANDHWGYIESLLEAHHVLNTTIELIEFHYKSAFIHGFKHGVESMEEMDRGMLATLPPTFGYDMSSLTPVNIYSDELTE